MLPFSNMLPDGTPVQDAEPTRWRETLQEVAAAGFSDIDLTDVWLRVGDLSPSRLDDLAQVTSDLKLRTPAISIIRRSVIDAAKAVENLEYCHRTIDAAAALGVGVISIGLHQALTPEQSRQLWFWTVDGYRDPDDRATWNTTVLRLRELGRHAGELGILLSLEMYEDTYLGSAESAIRLVEDIGMNTVGLNPDTGNLLRLHRPIENWSDLLARVLPYSNYWHMKNYLRDEDLLRDSYVSMPSTLEVGVINYRDAVRLAIAHGFQGIICTEHYGGDGLSVCATNREYLRRRVLPPTPEYTAGTSRVAQWAPAIG